MDRARGKLPGVGIGDWPAAFAAGTGVAACKARAQRVGEVGGQRAAVIVAGTSCQRYLLRQLDARQRRVGLDARDPGCRIRREGEHQGAVVHQKRVGCRVVGAQRLAIKTPRVGRPQRKSTAVDHDVPFNLVDTQALYAPHQQPQPLHHEFGVALALDIDVAVEHHVAGFGLAFVVQVNRRVPGIGRAQGVQCRKGRHQLDHRGRLHGAGALVAQARGLAMADFCHQQRHGFGWHFGTGQFGAHQGWNLGKRSAVQEPGHAREQVAHRHGAIIVPGVALAPRGAA